MSNYIEYMITIYITNTGKRLADISSLFNKDFVRATDQAIQTVTRYTVADVTRDNMKMLAYYEATQT